MVENKKKGRGRPRTFDEGKALDRAIQLFWTKGFDATSLDDLSSTMGMGRPSLYLAFGDKEALFLRALTRYAETTADGPLRAMESAETVREAIDAYLRGVVGVMTDDPTHSGCMLGPVACAVDSPAVRDFVVNTTSEAQIRVARRLQRAVDSGELPQSFPVGERARRAINAMLALSMRSKHCVPTDELLGDVAEGVSIVLT